MEPSFVSLVSGDGVEFVLPVAVARRCGFVARILAASRFAPGAPAAGADAAASPAVRLELPDIHSSVLDVLCQFVAEAHAKAGAAGAPLDMAAALAHLDPGIPEDRAFVLELLVAADYLSC